MWPCGLMMVLCIAPSVAGVAALGALGVLSGPHGNADRDPAWSPDGRYIAFTSDRDGNWDIFVMNSDGSKVGQLTRDPFADLYLFQSPADTHPSWSPDGARIMFLSGRDNGYMTYVAKTIYVMPSDGSNVNRVIFTKLNQQDWPA